MTMRITMSLTPGGASGAARGGGGLGEGAVALKRSIMRIITIALLTTLATLAPVNAQDATFRDAYGRTTGSARTDANGVTTFHDRSGRVTGTARTDRNGVTTFKDAAGRTTGSIRHTR